MSLSAFVDFMLATRAAALSDPGDIANQASKYRTYLWPLMLRGLAKEATFQGGTEIVDFVQLKAVNTFRYYNPTDTFNFTATNSLTQLKLPWRFWMVDMVTFEHEIDLNQGDRATVFKRLKRAKEKAMEQDYWEGCEAALWAAPDKATMEDTTLVGVGRPLSLRAMATWAGSAPTVAGDGATSAWSTVMQVNPTDYPNWRNQVVTYDNTSQATRESTIIPAMDKMWLRVQYQSPDNREAYFQSTTLQKMQILMNEVTYLLCVKLATEKNNILTPRHDLGYQNGLVTYHGLPMKYVASLDNIDTGDDAGSTHLYAQRWLNFNHIRPIWHTGHYRRLIRKDGGAANPHAEVVMDDNWGNLWLGNRREQGVLRAA